MLLSMTGFGEAHTRTDERSVSVEIRTVNNRYLKLSLRAPDGFGRFESEIESLVREHIRRGTVQVSIRIQRQRRAEDYRLNEAALTSYWNQLRTLQMQWQSSDPIKPDALLNLPGIVVDDRDLQSETEAEWPLLQQALQEALERLSEMRAREGAAMAEDLRLNLDSIAEQLQHVEAAAPQVVEQYREKLRERLTKVLSEHQVTLEPEVLVREVAVFADRSDISEEVVRLRTHINEMRNLISQRETSGRKLDFLTQEMFRETNTIGSKCNAAEIAQRVVEMKTAIERIREMVQNVE